MHCLPASRYLQSLNDCSLPRLQTQELPFDVALLDNLVAQLDITGDGKIEYEVIFIILLSIINISFLTIKGVITFKWNLNLA